MTIKVPVVPFKVPILPIKAPEELEPPPGPRKNKKLKRKKSSVGSASKRIMKVSTRLFLLTTENVKISVMLNSDVSSCLGYKSFFSNKGTPYLHYVHVVATS